MLTILKSGNASTLDIIRRIKETLPADLGRPAARARDQAAGRPVGLRHAPRSQGVIREAVIAACLTALMILIFLGSWRSTVIIAVSIPLSILTSIIVLSALGETINIMTLGGLALAVGILVDDATVAIENINWHLEQGKPLVPAILDGADQIAMPAFVSTLCICIVFVPMFFLTGVARYLFVPMAEAVVFAMLASYVLSRTLVPTMAKYLLKPHQPVHAEAPARIPRPASTRASTTPSSASAAAYRNTLERCLARRRLFAGAFLARLRRLVRAAAVGRAGLLPGGRQRTVQAALRAPTGTRIEETAVICDQVDQVLREIVPPARAGQHHRQHRPAVQRPQPLVHELGADRPAGRRHPRLARRRITGPTAEYIHDLRIALPTRFPACSSPSSPADIVSQILNFGLPAPIDVQVVGRNIEANRRFAATLLQPPVDGPGHRRPARPSGLQSAVAAS